MTWPATNVMMLGKLRPSFRIEDPDYAPRPTIDYVPINVTPLPGQNVIRQVVMNGVKGVKQGLYGVHGLGDDVLQPEPGPTIPGEPGSYPVSMADRYAAMPTWWKVTYPTLILASGAVSLYHGYKRNNSLGWGLAWWLMGTAFPVITPTVAFAQGFGKRKGR
jgi:hypothetical protein